MPDSARCAVPVFRPSDYVVWSLDAEGCVSSAFGDGLRLLGAEPSELIGRHVRDLYADRPDLLMTFRRLLAGHSVSHTAEVGGVLWRIEAEPMMHGGQVVGASGLSTAIHADRPEPIAAEPRRREWVLRPMPPGVRCAFVPGTRFVKVDGAELIAFGGLVPESEFMGLLMEHGRYLDLVRDSDQSSRSRRPAYPRLLA